MAEALANRVYDVKIAGFEDAVKQMDLLTASFEQMDAAKRKLNISLQQKTETGDQAGITELTQKIKDLETEMAKLKTQREASAKEVALLSRAEKDSALTLLATEKATLAVAQAEKVRLQTVTLENKEKAQQAANEEKQRAALERERLSVDNLTASYNILRNQRIALERLTANPVNTTTINFNEQSLSYTEALDKLKQIRVEEQFFAAQLKQEKIDHEDIERIQKEEILSIQQKKTEIQNLINTTQKGENITVVGQSLTRDEAIGQVERLRSEEQLLTEQLINERSIRQASIQSEQQKLSVLRQQRIELESLTAEAAKNSTVTFNGSTFSETDALEKLKTIKAEEQGYIAQLRSEKTVQESIILDQQSKINAIRAERLELESLTKNTTATSTISFGGNEFSQAEALSRVQELKRTESLLTKQQTEDTQLLLSIQKELTVIERQESTESLAAGRKKLEQIKEEKEANESLLAVENKRNDAKKAAELGPFEIPQGSGQSGNRGIINTPVTTDAFIPASDLEQNILLLVKTKTALADVQAEQKNLRDLLKSGSISQEEFNEKIVKATSLELEYKNTIAATNAEIKSLTNIDSSIEGSIKNLEARNKILAAQRDSIPIVNPSASEIDELKGINLELDKNNELIRVNKDLLAQQKINIGNYGASFKGALTVIETELNNVNNKLKGTLTVQEVDVFTKKQDLLTKSTVILNQEFTSSIQRTKAYKEVAQELGIVFGKNSDVFRNFVAQAGAGNKELVSINKSVKEGIDGGTKFGGVFTKIYSGFRQLANFIPGLGISGIVLLLIAPLEALATSIFKVGKNATGAGNSVADLEQRLKDVNEDLEKSAKGYEDAFVTVNKFKNEIELAKQGLLDKDKVLKEYNESLGKTTGFVNSLDEAEQALVRNGDAYIHMMLLKAAANLALEEAAKKAFEAAVATNKQDKEFITTGDLLVSALAESGDAGFSAEEANKANLEAAKRHKDEIIKNAEAGKTEQLNIATAFFKQAQDIEDGFNNNSIGKIQKLKSQIDSLKKEQPTLIDPAAIQANAAQIKSLEDQIKTLTKPQGVIQELENRIVKLKADRAGLLDEAAIKSNVAEVKKLEAELDRLNGKAKQQRSARLAPVENDSIKLVEAQRDNELAVENLKIALLRERRQTTVDEETQHLIRLQTINDEADVKKINSIKGHNAAEIAERSKLELQIINRKIQTNTEIQNLYNKEFDEESKILKKQFETQKSQIEVGLSFVLVDRQLTNEDRAVAKRTSDQKILEETTTYYNNLIALAQKNKQKTESIEQEKQKAVTDIIKSSLNDDENVTEGFFKDFDEKAARHAATIKLKYDKLKEEILSSTQSTGDKTAAVNNLDKTQSVEIATSNLDVLLGKLAQAEKSYAVGKIKLKEYLDIHDAVVKAKEDLNSAIEAIKVKYTSLMDLASRGLAKLFGFQKGTEAAKQFGVIVGQAFDLAGQAMNNYFDQEAQRIERSKQVNLQRLDVQQSILENAAQSEAERNSIQRQFDAKRDEENRIAFEKDKKLKKEQVTINYAIQLSNIAVAASANPLNPFTFGAAGIAQYIIQAAIATAGYLLNLSNINKSQYAKGGFTGPGAEIDSTGHRVAGVVHEDEWVSPKWMVKHVKYGPIIEELEDVRKRGFADGGYTSKKLRKFAVGGFTGIGDISLGDSLQAPVNPSLFLRSQSSTDSGKTDEKLSSLITLIAETSRQTNQRIDRIKVQVVSKEVTNSQNKIKKATAVGTL